MDVANVVLIPKDTVDRAASLIAGFAFTMMQLAQLPEKEVNADSIARAFDNLCRFTMQEIYKDVKTLGTDGAILRAAANPETADMLKLLLKKLGTDGFTVGPDFSNLSEN